MEEAGSRQSTPSLDEQDEQGESQSEQEEAGSRQSAPTPDEQDEQGESQSEQEESDGGEEEIDPYYTEIENEEIRLGLTDDPTEAYHSLPGHPDGEYSHVGRGKGDVDKVNSHWVVGSGEVPDGKFEADEMLDPQTKLQLILRKAFEYRMLNSLEAQYVRTRSDNITFLSLVLSGISSVLLLMNSFALSGAVAAILTAAVTTLTGYNSYMHFTDRYEKHTASVKAFANLQRDVMAALQTKNDDEITDNFTEYSVALSAAIANMPLVEQSRMDTYKRKVEKDGTSVWESYFPNISDMARWNESVENIKSMKDLDIFTEKPPMEEDDEVAEKLRATVNGYMRRLSSVKASEKRKVLRVLRESSSGKL